MRAPAVVAVVILLSSPLWPAAQATAGSARLLSIQLGDGQDWAFVAVDTQPSDWAFAGGGWSVGIEVKATGAPDALVYLRCGGLNAGHFVAFGGYTVPGDEDAAQISGTSSANHGEFTFACLAASDRPGLTIKALVVADNTISWNQAEGLAPTPLRALAQGRGATLSYHQAAGSQPASFSRNVGVDHQERTASGPVHVYDRTNIHLNHPASGTAWHESHVWDFGQSAGAYQATLDLGAGVRSSADIFAPFNSESIDIAAQTHGGAKLDVTTRAAEWTSRYLHVDAATVPIDFGTLGLTPNEFVRMGTAPPVPGAAPQLL